MGAIGAAGVEGPAVALGDVGNLFVGMALSGTFEDAGVPGVEVAVDLGIGAAFVGSSWSGTIPHPAGRSADGTPPELALVVSSAPTAPSSSQCQAWTSSPQSSKPGSGHPMATSILRRRLLQPKGKNSEQPPPTPMLQSLPVPSWRPS